MHTYFPSLIINIVNCFCFVLFLFYIWGFRCWSQVLSSPDAGGRTIFPMCGATPPTDPLLADRETAFSEALRSQFGGAGENFNRQGCIAVCLLAYLPVRRLCTCVACACTLKMMAARRPARLALKYGSAMRGVSPIVARSALDDARCSSDSSNMCTAYAYANFCDSDEKSARVLYTCAQASSV